MNPAHVSPASPRILARTRERQAGVGSGALPGVLQRWPTVTWAGMRAELRGGWDAPIQDGV